MIIKRPE